MNKANSYILSLLFVYIATLTSFRVSYTVHGQRKGFLKRRTELGARDKNRDKHGIRPNGVSGEQHPSGEGNFCRAWQITSAHVLGLVHGVRLARREPKLVCSTEGLRVSKYTLPSYERITHLDTEASPLEGRKHIFL